MPAFRKPSKIDPELVTFGKKNYDGDFAFFTGGVKSNRKASGRTAVLALVRPARKPIPLAALIERSKDVTKDGRGFEPAFVRGGLFNDTGAKGAIYFLLRRDEKGNYRAVRDIPFPDAGFSKRPFKAGDIVVAASAEKAAPALPAPAAPVGGEN